MEDITINMQLEAWAGKWDISDGEDIDYTAETYAEACFYLAKQLAEKSDYILRMGLQAKIDALD
jgi:hypothetical protein